MKRFELPNIGDGRKSFYGKALQIELNDGTIQLQSYETIVGQIKNGACRIYDTYSATTLRHIKSWLRYNNLPCGSKKEIENMYMNRSV